MPTTMKKFVVANKTSEYSAQAVEYKSGWYVKYYKQSLLLYTRLYLKSMNPNITEEVIKELEKHGVNNVT